MATARLEAPPRPRKADGWMTPLPAKREIHLTAAEAYIPAVYCELLKRHAEARAHAMSEDSNRIDANFRSVIWPWFKRLLEDEPEFLRNACDTILSLQNEPE